MKKILIVDDDINIRELLESRLNANGYEVVQASNGVEAFVKAKDENPDLIILDASMPVMDGYEFAKEARWQDSIKDIPILVLTAMAQTKSLFNSLGIDNFISKPFKSDELLCSISGCVNN